MSGIQLKLLVQIMLGLMVAAQATAGVTSSEESTESRRIPSGVVPFLEYGLIYKSFESQLTNSEARQACINEGGQLAVVDSREKVEKVLNFFSSVSSVWVGLIRTQYTHEWTTIDGQPRQNLPWADWEPNGFGQCASLSRSFRGLLSYECTVQSAYLCEIPFFKH